MATLYIKINKMVLPTVTIKELSDATQDKTLGPSTHKVLVGMLNDFMDLQYAKETPYTTGKRVLPNDTTLEDVDKAAADESAQKKFRDIFQCIAETERSGDLTPRSINNNDWDPRFTPVLVLVTPNP